VSAVNVPFEIPKGWAWARLDFLCRSIVDGDHQAPPQEMSGIPFLVISNISNGELDFSNTRFVGEDYYKSLQATRIPAKGDILVTVTGSYGIIVRVDTNRHFCFQRHMALLKCCGNGSDYLFYALQSNTVKRYLDAIATGTAQKTVALHHLRNTLIPIPPVYEQKRIVAKIEELFSIAVSLGSAADGLETAAKRLDKKILDLAIRGRLVPQDPKDEPASELLKRIAATSHKSPSKNQSEPIDPPFEIPDSWEWVRLETICDFYLGKTPPRANQQYWIPPAVPWVTISDMIQHGRVTQTKEGVSSYAITKGVSGRISPKGTLLMSFKLTIGKVSILDCDATHNEAIISVLPYCDSSKTMRNYLFETLPCLVGNAETSPAIMGDTLNKKTLGNLLIPLPPLAEQKRIVAKIEELRTVIKSLTT
jgi:type I restriction enzyme S subunit